MNAIKNIACLIVLSITANFALADQLGNGHQDKMQKHILKMEQILGELQKESNLKERRDLMTRHAEFMEVSISLEQDMINRTLAEHQECLEREKGVPAGDETCYSAETHADTRDKLMFVLIRHLIERQNMLMKSAGMIRP